MRYGSPTTPCARFSGAAPPAPRPGGFTYLGLLFAVAIIGATLAAAGTVWHTAQQRERERELLFAGDHIRQAIGLYYNAGRGSARQFPQRLEDLLRDPRQPSVVHYLRKLYYDPMTGTRQWGLIKTTGDRIIGVFSTSDARPIKQANFDTADRDFEGKKKYSEWTFIYRTGHPIGTNKTPANPVAPPTGTETPQ